jgi:hypothetical protein
MPNQSHSGLETGPWHRCDRCGMEYPVGQLQRQRGLILCTTKCVDDTLSSERDAIIQQVLEEGNPEPDIAEILKEPSDVDTEPDEL